MESNTDWQALRSDWQAASPLEQLVAESLRGSLRWRIWASRAWFVLEILSFLFVGFVMVMNFIAGEIGRGAGVAALLVFCLVASVWARRGRLVGNLQSIPGMVEFTLARARKSLRMVYGTYAVIAVVAIATIIDAQFPLREDERFLFRLVWVALCAGMTVAYQLYVEMRIRRFEAIRRSLQVG